MIAAAAAISGLIRWVRPPPPWRPSKLRLEVEAQRSPGCQDVGVHAQAHRAARARATRSPQRGRARPNPQPRLAALTWADPGTTMARTASATRRPSTTSAAARRSSIRELVQEPMNTRSIAMSCSGVPGRQVHVGQRRARRSSSPGSGTRAGDRGDLARVRAPRDLRRDSGDVDRHLAVEGRRPRRMLARASARPPRRSPPERPAGPRGRRRWCRRGRSCRPARPPRSTCWRSSCALPSRGRGWPRPRTRSRARRRRRCRSGRSCPGSCPWRCSPRPSAPA